MKVTERITPTKDIVFKDCSSSATFTSIRYNFVIYLAGFFILNLTIINETKNLTGEYGLIKMAKFVRWLHWQTVVSWSLWLTLHPSSVHSLVKCERCSLVKNNCYENILQCVRLLKEIFLCLYFILSCVKKINKNAYLSVKFQETHNTCISAGLFYLEN